MCIHGDKSQPERDWVLTGATNTLTAGDSPLSSPPSSSAQPADCECGFHLQSSAAARLQS